MHGVQDIGLCSGHCSKTKKASPHDKHFFRHFCIRNRIGTTQGTSL